MEPALFVYRRPPGAPNGRPMPALKEIGFCHFALGDYAAAEKSWTQAMQQESLGNKATLQGYVAYISLRLGLWQEALTRAIRAEQISNDLPINGLLILIANEHLSKKANPDQAEKIYSRLCKYDAWAIKILLPQDLWHYVDNIKYFHNENRDILVNEALK